MTDTEEKSEPSRYWRAMCGVRGWYVAVMHGDLYAGPLHDDYRHDYPTRAEAEADGRASGLEEWKP